MTWLSGVTASSRDAEELMRVALGEEPPDLVIASGRVFDAVTSQFRPGRSLWIKGGRIARVTDAGEPLPAGVDTLDASGLTLVPGLIDGHTHLVSIFFPEFVRALLPTGVTSVVMETMEFAATTGLAGVQLSIEAMRDQPLRFFHTLPAMCGLTEEEEAGALSRAEIARLLPDAACLGLGEAYWSNALLPGAQGQRVRELITLTLESGKRAEGHTAGARGDRLQAYRALGITSCHEPIDVAEALDRYQEGFFVMLREGGIRRDLEALRPLFDLPLDFTRFALVTDSVDPERLGSWGYLDEAVREALALGIAPEIVYRLSSTNVAEHFGLGEELGYLAPGRLADLVALPSPGDFRPVFVMVGGQLVFLEGRTLAEPRSIAVPPDLLRTSSYDPEMVRVLVGSPPVPSTALPTRVIQHVSNLVTREAILSPDEAAMAGDLLPLLAMERTRGRQFFWGFLEGYGLEGGAYGTTMCWDSPDLLVVGRDERSIHAVLGRLAENGGGRVFARDGGVVAEFRAPICGVASAEPAGQVRRELSHLRAALRQAGTRWEDPLLALDTLTTPAIPHMRITHRGYVRLRDRALLPVSG